MNSNSKKTRRPAFTIVELLTVMSIIIILIGLLVPALNRVRRYAKEVKQKAQFHSIAIALDLFNAEYESYPDSNERDDDTPSRPYCGAMKLCEAMVGQDLKGFHPKSRFRRAGFSLPNVLNITVYPRLNWPNPADYTKNIRSRKRYLELENANAYQLRDIYSNDAILTEGFDPNTFVLCDVYTRVTHKRTGRKIGMPILYYRAHPLNTKHQYYPGALIGPRDSERYNIYDVYDNRGMTNLGLPWNPGPDHPMGFGAQTSIPGVAPDPRIFYDITRNPNIPTNDRPYKDDSYILISAGFDGEYGTSDDIFNFGE